jgi:hypothetical protein
VDAATRKTYPIASGVLGYFPNALAVISHVSYRGNEQHNPGQPLHWDRTKSTDEADALIRHFLLRGTLDTDGLRHSAKMAWRALALLQKEIEAEVTRATNQATSPPLRVVVCPQTDVACTSSCSDREVRECQGFKMRRQDQRGLPREIAR